MKDTIDLDDLKYPYNLACAILEKKLDSYPLDLEATIQYVLHVIDNSDKKLLMDRYVLMIPWATMESIYGTTRHHISRRINRILRYINTGYGDLIQYGLDRYIHMQVEYVAGEDGVNKLFDDMMQTPIDKLRLSMKTYDVLKDAGVKNLWDVLSLYNTQCDNVRDTHNKLWRLPGLDERRYNELINILKAKRLIPRDAK